MALREYNGKPRVTTFVTASRDGNNETELGKICTFPLNAISVQRDHVREIMDVSERSPTSSGGVSDRQRVGNLGSTDDLFAKYQRSVGKF